MGPLGSHKGANLTHGSNSSPQTWDDVTHASSPLRQLYSRIYGVAQYVARLLGKLGAAPNNPDDVCAQCTSRPFEALGVQWRQGMESFDAAAEAGRSKDMCTSKPTESVDRDGRRLFTL
ncbi:hypothetical protein BHE74_00029057 [Ensete ventricosum]|nr:hypothetical protein BHE74_00029057 [Ensete ventricosum]